LTLANSSSAKKRIRQNARRRVRNILVRTRARSRVRAARQAVEAGEAAMSKQAVEAAIRELDRAAAKGVIHANNASRRKQRLQRLLRSASAEAKA
jgi:small subunit ribosomal protein S20